MFRFIHVWDEKDIIAIFQNLLKNYWKNVNLNNF